MYDKKKLLIIEDEQMIIDIFSIVLKKHFQIFTAKTLEEFEQEITKSVYDVFIVDISLRSYKDGIQIIKELREMPSYKSSPIIVVTAHAFKRDEQNAIEAGATLYLQKPIENETLLRKLSPYA